MSQNEPSAEPKVDLLAEEPTYLFYKPASTVWGVMIGGPLAVAYMQAKNYLNMGDRHKAWRPWAAWISGMLLIMFLQAFVPLFDRIPGIVYSISMAAVAHATTSRIFADGLRLHDESGGSFYKPGNVAVVIFLGLISYLAVVAGFFVATDYEGFMELFSHASRSIYNPASLAV